MNPPIANKPLDEADIAAYLAATPAFFERHAELLAGLRLTSPHGQRAITLSERQMEMLRERIKGLEMKIVEMIRAGQENLALVDRLHRFTRTLMRTGDAAALPGIIVATLKHEFIVPQVAVRLWSLAPEFAAGDFARTQRQRRREDLRGQSDAALLRRECGLRGGGLARRSSHGGEPGDDPAAPGRQRVWPAGAGLP